MLAPNAAPIAMGNLADVQIMSFLQVVECCNWHQIWIFDRDARRSGPTIHFHGFVVTLVQNLL